MIASITSQLTGWIADHGVAAVFALMAVDALLPVGGELIMLFAGAVAGGAIIGAEVSLLGLTVSDGIDAYLVLSTAGALGYLAGSIVGWVIGRQGGRALIESHGRWLHLPPNRLARADAWFDRYGNWAVLVGRVTPIVRSFISVPAGVFGSPLGPYTALTLLGSSLWCFGFAAAGWALGSNWEHVHHAFRFADLAAVIAAAGIVVLAARHRLGKRRSLTP